MTVRELMSAIESASLHGDAEVYGACGPIHCVHVEDGVLVLDETAPALVHKLSRFDDNMVLWPEGELATV